MENPRAETLREPSPGVYHLEPDASVVRFRTRAVFGLLPVRGTFTIGHGELSVADPLSESSVEVVIRADSFDTGNARRDQHVRSADFLDTVTHPDIRFRGGSVRRSADGATVHGELTAHGMTRPVVLTVGSVTADEKRLEIRATARVDRYAFGVTRSKGMAGRHLDVEVEVVASR